MVIDKIKEIIANQLDIDVNEIQNDSNLIEDLKADSLDVVELIMDLEQEFDVEIPNEELENIKTVEDIAKYIEK